MSKHILVADDEIEIINLLKLYLENDGYDVTTAFDGAEALLKLKHNNIDLAIIDIMMPKMDGYNLIKFIRKDCNLPIIILSAKDTVSDKILGLGLGADDYISKPFDALEVVARVGANLRRFYQLGSKEPLPTKYIVLHDLQLDTEECVLKKGDAIIELTSIEYKILYLLMKSPGQVFTKKQIYETAWGESYIVDDNNIMVYISKIREKLGERNGQSYIKTIRGLGYKMLSQENYYEKKNS